jgi:hypothetical protein
MGEINMSISRNISHSPEDLEREAEELTGIAIDDNLSPKQLRTLYDIIRAKTPVELKMHVKYQMGRNSDYRNPIISPRTGDKILDQKPELITILRFSNMIYDYERMNHSRSRLSPTTNLNESVEKNIEEIIGNATKNYEFAGVSFERDQRGYLTINVSLNRFYDDPKPLSDELKNRIKNDVKEMRNALFRVWIQKR